MEKTKNIFIFPVLLAWLIIFTHDTIPHNHHHSILCSHNKEQPLPGNEHDSCCHEQMSDEREHSGCHFSVDVLPHFSLDQEFDLPLNVQTVAVGVDNYVLRYFSDHLRTKPLYLVQNHMRAPPLS